ncbi:MAG: segregation/condensation protein A [Methanocalculaceae archaeon]|nr:segregation/condensation protein A [Methanocalculaceae archaeon]
MVECGEIDPWNIDIVEVTDRFLGELERRCELDLRISGRTLFYSSVLLRMKSEYLDAPQEQEKEEFADEDPFARDADPFSEDTVTARALGPIEMLEREIERRIKRKDARKRPVTLYDLIAQLQLAERADRRCQRRKKSVNSDEKTFPEPDAMDVDAMDVVGIAHDEAYDAMAQQIYAIVCEHPDARNPGVSLYELMSALRWPLYQVYIPCLFLMQDGLVELEQNEFFGDLLVVISEIYATINEK